MVKRNKLIIWAVALVFIFAGILSGCETTFDPFIEGKALYSIYGYLDVNRPVNYIRVKDLDTPITADSARKLNAKVTLTNLATGQSQILQDSVVRFNGIYTHNFRTTMDITPETKYRVQVTRPDGKSVSATTITPAIPKMNTTFSVSPFITFQPVNRKSVFRYTLSLYPFSNDDIEINNFCITLFDFQKRNPRAGLKLIKVPGYCTPKYVPNRPKVRYIKILKKFLRLPDTGKLTNQVYMIYKYFSPGSFKPVTTSDSLSIPGGSGQFGAVYTDTLKIELSQ